MVRNDCTVCRQIRLRVKNNLTVLPVVGFALHIVGPSVPIFILCTVQKWRYRISSLFYSLLGPYSTNRGWIITNLELVDLEFWNLLFGLQIWRAMTKHQRRRAAWKWGMMPSGRVCLMFLKMFVPLLLSVSITDHLSQCSWWGFDSESVRAWIRRWIQKGQNRLLEK